MRTTAIILRGASAWLALGLPAMAHAQDAGHASSDQADDQDIVVTGKYTLDKRIDTATGLGLTLRETPQSVSVITQQRILDQNLVSVADVIENSAGVTVSEIDDVRNTFYARGFEIRNYQIDGVPTAWTLAGGAGETIADVSIYDRVEIVRGATGLLSGAGDPSASVNLVRKHADGRVWGGYANVSYGSWNTLRISGDVGGALTADGRVRVRAVGRFEEGDSYVDLYHNRKFIAYGTIDADLTDTTLLRAGISQQQGRPRAQSWGSLPSFYSDGRFAVWPRSKSTSARWAYWNTTNQNIFATLRHDFGGGWTITANYNRLRNAQSTQLLYLYGLVDRASGNIQFAYPYKDRGASIQNSLDVQVKGTLHLFGRDHELVLGALRSIQNRDDTTYAAMTYPSDVPFVSVAGNYIADPGFSTASTLAVNERIKQTGVYGAMRLNLSDAFKLIGGGRLASWQQTGVSFGVPSNYGNDNTFIPYLGALYDLTPHHRLYASFTKIFQPQNALDRNLVQLAPLDGKAYEFGLKNAFFNEALQTTVALFRIEQDNLAQPDTIVTPPGGGLPQQTYVAAKGTKSDGVEVEVTGRPLPGWNVNAGFSHFWAHDANGNMVSADQPRALFKLFTTYTLDGLTLGGGVNYRSKAYSSGTNPVTAAPFRFQQNGYALVNVMARYVLSDRLQLQANLENLLDKTYYSEIGFFDQYRYGAPRNVTVGATLKF